MPYLDIADPDNFTHLLQLFAAAHPHYQRENAKVRAQTGLPEAYLGIFAYPPEKVYSSSDGQG